MTLHLFSAFLFLCGAAAVSSSDCYYKIGVELSSLACPSYQKAQGSLPKLPLVTMVMGYQLSQANKNGVEVRNKEKFQANQKVPAVLRSQSGDQACWDVVGLRVFDGALDFDRQDPAITSRDGSKKFRYLYDGEYNDMKLEANGLIDCESEVTNLRLAREPFTVMKKDKKDYLLINFEMDTSLVQRVTVNTLQSPLQKVVFTKLPSKKNIDDDPIIHESFEMMQPDETKFEIDKPIPPILLSQVKNKKLLSQAHHDVSNLSQDEINEQEVISLDQPMFRDSFQKNEHEHEIQTKLQEKEVDARSSTIQPVNNDLPLDEIELHELESSKSSNIQPVKHDVALDEIQIPELDENKILEHHFDNTGSLKIIL